MLRRLMLLTLFILVLQSAWAGAQTDSQLFLDKIKGAVETGQISAEQALLYRFHYAFDQQRLPVSFQPESFSPLKSGTPMIQEFLATRDKLSSETVEIIEAYLAPPEDQSRVYYYSDGGHFRLYYVTSGVDAVPLADYDSSGYPDFIENCAEYFEYVWQREVVDQRFTAPPIGSGTYLVSFAALNGIYGYTSPQSGGYTTITMDNNFIGFPPNDDPDGNALGAAKVTAAHEFKHATQYAGSNWSEGGWVEVDATWAEEFVYPATNDYLNYLFSGGNSISQPYVPLDSGGSGSYEDCVWQMFQSQMYTDDIITDLWNWRIGHQSQSMMDSYEQMFIDYGSTMKETWAMYTAWNYATGTRTIAGLGYEEANRYPTGALANTMTSYPATYTGSVQHLAANNIRVLGVGGILGECVVEFDGANSGDFTLAATIKLRDGTGVIEVIPLDSANDCEHALATNLDDIEWIGFTVGNAGHTGSYLAYEITVNRVEDLPDPHLELDSASIMQNMDSNQIATEYLQLTNNGEPESVMNYAITVWDDSPLKGADDKSIAGSEIWFETDTYMSGSSATLVVWVTNGSTDEEWLTDMSVDFPPGVNVLNASVVVGGTYGYMSYMGQSGDGAEVAWHGTYGAQGYGVIIEGESAYANINVVFDEGLSGDLVIPYTITGDGYGSPPHTISGTTTIVQVGAEMSLYEPGGGEVVSVGETFDIEWFIDGLTEVKIDLSRNGGADWEVVTENTPNDGVYSWTVTGPGSTNCLMRVSSLDDLSSDISGDPFTIFAPASWLTVVPDEGQIPNGSSETVALNFDTTGLYNATYTAWIMISHDGDNGPTIVPVTLVVGDPTAAGQIPEQFALESVFPNPFNPTATIRFALPTESPVVVDVLDLRGMRVRTIVTERMTAGIHDIQWDGRDDSGQIVAAGTYLARLRAADFMATSKMVLAK